MKRHRYAIKSAQITPEEREKDYLQMAEVARDDCDYFKMEIYLEWAKHEIQERKHNEG